MAPPSVPFTFPDGRGIDITGKIHLYRSDGPLGRQGSGDTAASAAAAAATGPEPAMAALLAVPSRFLPSDLCQFAAPFLEGIRRTRVLRDANPKRYLAVFSFVTPEKAAEFVAALNGQAYNSFETEIARVVLVDSITIDGRGGSPSPSASGGVEADGAGTEELPGEEPAAGAAAPGAQQSKEIVFALDPDFRLSSTAPAVEQPAAEGAAAGSAPAATAADLKVPDRRAELPSCPVCLERLDTSCTGLITTICGHSFHHGCLRGWADSSCPVCRYHFDPEDEQPRCEECGATHDLWMCLLCGAQRCSRYHRGCALKHFEHTGHTYAIELGSQRVWDYAGDGWVHRLIHNEVDRKMIEVPDPSVAGSAGAGASGSVAHHLARGGPRAAPVAQASDMADEKIAAAYAEYNQLLTSQLEEQRKFFERRLSEQRAEASLAREAVVQRALAAEQRAADADHRASSLEAELRSANQAVKKARAANEHQAREVEVLKALNRSLVANQRGWEEKVEAAQAALQREQATAQGRIAEMEAQVQDLMFTLDTRAKVKASGAEKEIQEGVVLVTQQQGSSPARGGGRAGGRGGRRRRGARR